MIPVTLVLKIVTFAGVQANAKIVMMDFTLMKTKPVQNAKSTVSIVKITHIVPNAMNLMAMLEMISPAIVSSVVKEILFLIILASHAQKIVLNAITLNNVYCVT